MLIIRDLHDSRELDQEVMANVRGGYGRSTLIAVSFGKIGGYEDLKINTRSPYYNSLKNESLEDQAWQNPLSPLFVLDNPRG